MTEWNSYDFDGCSLPENTISIQPNGLLTYNIPNHDIKEFQFKIDGLILNGYSHWFDPTIFPGYFEYSEPYRSAFHQQPAQDRLSGEWDQSTQRIRSMVV